MNGRITSARPKKPMNTNWSMATKPADFDATDKKAVTGVGAPS